MKNFTRFFLFTIFFLLSGFLVNTLPINTYAFACEDDTCVSIPDGNGGYAGACVDASAIPGQNDGFNCDAGSSGCTLTVCS